MKTFHIALILFCSISMAQGQIIDSFPWYKAELNIVSPAKLSVPMGLKIGKSQLQTTSDFKFVTTRILNDTLLYLIPRDFDHSGGRFPVSALSKSARIGKVYLPSLKNTAVYAITCPSGKITRSTDGRTIQASSDCTIQRTDGKNLKKGSFVVIAPNYSKPN